MSEANEQRYDEVLLLRKEVVSLHSLLDESANALKALNDKYNLEREHNSRLMEYIARAEQIELGLRTENEQMRKRIAEVEQRSGAAPEESLAALTERQDGIVQSIRTLAEDLIDRAAEVDIDIQLLLDKFPTIAFERQPEPEDPYKSTKGWAGRRNGRTTSSKSKEEPTVEGIEEYNAGSPARTLYQSPEHSVAFAFGSPSERFPIFSAEDQPAEEGEEEEEEGELANVADMDS